MYTRANFGRAKELWMPVNLIRSMPRDNSFILPKNVSLLFFLHPLGSTFARRCLDDYTLIGPPIRYEPRSWRDTATVAGYGKRETATPRLKSVPGRRHDSIQEGWEPKAQEQAELRLYAKNRIGWGSSSMRCVCVHPSLPTEIYVNLLPRPKQSLDPSIVSRFCFNLPTLNLLNTLVHGSGS